MDKAVMIKNILRTTEEEMMNTADKDNMYRLYRDARTWNRLNYLKANLYSEEMYRYVILQLKHYKSIALKHFY